MGKRKTRATVTLGGAGELRELAKASDIVAGVITLPIVTVSVLNVREHWAKRAKRSKEHRGLAAMMTRLLTLDVLPGVVTMIRVSPRALDDDNLRGALKACRDGVADALGIDDRDSRVKWEYKQEKGAASVRIELDK